MDRKKNGVKDEIDDSSNGGNSDHDGENIQEAEDFKDIIFDYE